MLSQVRCKILPYTLFMTHYLNENVSYIVENIQYLTICCFIQTCYKMTKLCNYVMVIMDLANFELEEIILLSFPIFHNLDLVPNTLTRAKTNFDASIILWFTLHEQISVLC